MGREDSPYIVGDFWLDKRRDGKSPDVWQVARYDARTRSISYRSTRAKGLDDAKAFIHSHVERMRALEPQRAEDAKVIPALFAYWDEHGRKADSQAQIASSIRQFIGFLMQDRATTDVTIADLNPALFTRFREWRMGPHSYSVPWRDGTISHSSAGVRGESVQRNLDDIRAALNHQAANARVPFVPKVRSVAPEFRSPPRERLLTWDEIGAIVGYFASDRTMLQFVMLMGATAVRPEAAMMFDPLRQFDAAHNLIDLHPPSWPRTKKVNPVVPCIAELRPWLRRWQPGTAKSRKTAWRTMRRALGLSKDVYPKTIRYTLASYLRRKNVPAEQVESLLGHRVYRGTSAVYAKYDPTFMHETASALSMFWAESRRAAKQWLAGHLRAKDGNEPTKIVDRAHQKRQIIKA